MSHRIPEWLLARCVLIWVMQPMFPVRGSACVLTMFSAFSRPRVSDLGLINVVGTCRPTTQMSIGDFTKIHPWYRLQKGPGLLTHILCIGQMAGIVIRNSQFSPRVWNGFQVSELRQVN